MQNKTYSLPKLTPLRVLLICGISALLGFEASQLHQNHLTFVIAVGSSMHPTLPDGTIYEGVKPNHLERGDIVTLIDDQNNSIVKRIIGLPGDKIQLSDGQLWMNGHLLQEPYLPKGTFTKPLVYGTNIVAGADEYIVMGDNRQVSYDSRAFGPVQKKQITHKVNIYTLAPK